MGAGRPAAIKKKAYIEIDLELLQSTGEIRYIGEPIVAPEITTQVPRGKFEITYTAELFGILERLGNKKIQVFSYLLDIKDGNNTVNTTMRKIAENTGTSTKTVNDTIQILRDAGLIEREGTVYMMSPRLMVKGSQVREAYLMRKYEELKPVKDTFTGQVIDAELEGQLTLLHDGSIVEKAK